MGNKHHNQSHKSGASKASSSSQWSREDPTSDYYQARTNFVADPRENRISHSQVMQQLHAPSSPPPTKSGKSSYPHQFFNKEELPCLPTPSLSRESSTEGYYEYPVFANGHNYDYDSKKPRDPPGHLRAVTNQNKRLKAVLAHEGELDPQGMLNPNFGKMHEANKLAAQQQSSSSGKQKKK